MSSSIHYRPEIDGLRCIAVLAVIAFHARQSIIPGGYLGVDVFFVISGYLITSIISREIADNTFSFSKFWDRRIKRILPAASFVLLAVSVLQSKIIFRPDLQLLANEKLAALLSFANIYFWKYTGDYWGSAAEESPYLHYWSLSIEEQYYLIYPILFFAAYSFTFTRKHLPKLILAVAIASLAAFAYGAVHHASATFYLLPTRIWQLGAGCLLAVSSNQTLLRNSSIGTLSGLSIIGFAFFLPSENAGIGSEAFFTVIGTCLVIRSGENKLASFALQNRGAVYIGKLSYSLYLWHWPIIVTLKKVRDYEIITSDAVLGVIGGGLLLILSSFSFYLIERPFRKLKYGTPITLIFSLSVGIYFIAIEPLFLNRSYESHYTKPSWHGKYYSLNPAGDLSAAFEVIADSVITPEREASSTAYKEGGIIRPRLSPEPKVLLIGDSHAVMWSKVIDEITAELNLTTSLWSMNGVSFQTEIPPIAHDETYITKSERYEYDTQRLHFIQKWNPDIVIIAARWENVPQHSVIGFFQFLEQHAKHVLILESPPALGGVGNRSLYQYLPFLKIQPRDAANANIEWEQVSFTNSSNIRDRLVRISLERSSFSFIPTADLFVGHTGAIVASGNQILYLDDDHLTDEGTKRAYSRIKISIQNILNGDRNSFPLVSDTGEEATNTLRSTALSSN